MVRLTVVHGLRVVSSEITFDFLSQLLEGQASGGAGTDTSTAALSVNVFTCLLIFLLVVGLRERMTRGVYYRVAVVRLLEVDMGVGKGGSIMLLEGVQKRHGGGARDVVARRNRYSIYRGVG